MIDKSQSVRSKGPRLFISRHRGFSLIEVLMSIVLIAIGISLALPSYRDMVEKRQVTNGAEQLASFINSAQGAAMKTNQDLWVRWDRKTDAEWCIGASTESNCTCAEANSCMVGGEEYVIDNSRATDRDLFYSFSGGENNSYRIDQVRGVVTDSEKNIIGRDSFPVFKLKSPSGDFRLNLIVNSTGRVILCSDDSEHSVPGYEPCPSIADIQLAETGS